MTKLFLTKQEKDTVDKFINVVKVTLGDNLILSALFGSKVRGDYSNDSDIDILFVVKEYNVKTSSLIFDNLFEVDPYYEFKISPLIYSEFEYKKNVEMKSPFIENIKSEGVWF
ncbi:MAG: nucleotidyltransferase domain-containing protein [Bacteroidia bacterium]|nr:nucleotidyltransferase domain-containing protein [Bacteroidia bacterium]